MLGIMLTAAGGAFLISLLATYLVRGLARRADFVDRPGAHKLHAAPVALGGGIALVASMCAPLLLGTAWASILRDRPCPEWVPDILQTHVAGIASKTLTILGIVGGAVVLHIVGLIDDRRPLGPWIKLSIQIIVASIIAGPMGIRAIEALPMPLSVGITILWIVLITNAFNFLDNMDGLSAGVAAIAAAIFAVAAMRTGQVFVPVMAMVVVGGLLGFLVFNFTPATIFMGDAGSLVIGFLMSVLTLLTTFYDPGRGLTPWGVLMPLVVLAVPLYDVISVVAHRLKAGVNPLRGDARHFSHRLVRRGFSRRGAVLTIYLATAATGLPAIILPTLDWTGAVLVLAQCLCVVIIIAVLEHTEQRLPA